MPVIETERFLVVRDAKWGKWEIRPLEISGLWAMLLGQDWDILWSSAPPDQHGGMYQLFEQCWNEAYAETGHDILVCEAEVEYLFEPPPGVRSLNLRPGVSRWAGVGEAWSILPKSNKEVQFIKGLVRTINMVQVNERNHVERRREGSFA